jgi:hypothetical protein
MGNASNCDLLALVGPAGAVVIDCAGRISRILTHTDKMPTQNVALIEAMILRDECRERIRKWREQAETASPFVAKFLRGCADDLENALNENGLDDSITNAVFDDAPETVRSPVSE